jgi:hypothetical protein
MARVIALGASLVCRVLKHHVPGQRRLDRHLGGLEVADFADHDDVRVLAHQRAQAFGEAESPAAAGPASG